MMTDDARMQRDSLLRLRAMLGAPEASVAVFCTHDPVEFAAMAAWSEADYAPLSAERVAA